MSIGVRVDGVSKVYAGSGRGRKRRPGAAALSGVSVEVAAGSWTVLLGPNGSGKSTLLGVVTGAVRASAGRVGLSGGELSGGRVELGVVFQTPALDGLLTVRENLMVAAALHGVRGAVARERAEVVAAAAGVAARLDERVARLSGGLARRADLARALVHRPGLLVLDEAAVGLDPGARREFLELVRQERRERGMTVVAATHLLDEVEDADRVVLLAGGRVVGDATPAALLDEVGGATGVVARVRRPGQATRVVPGGLSAAEAEELVRGGAWVSQGPATLEDVYLARTGAGL
jgi:ABC-2 type transport system ATP-binding protein